MKKIVLALLVVLVASLAAQPAIAKMNIYLGSLVLGPMTQGQFKDFSRELGLAISYSPLAPAEPLGGGVLPHVDVGIAATYADIKSGATYWKVAATNVPTYLGFAKVQAQVGIPFIPVDLGFVYAVEQDSDIKYAGGEIKLAILKGGVATPALALRGAYTKMSTLKQSGIDMLDVDTKSLDLSISKGFAMLTPYAGVGGVWITSKPKFSPLSPLLTKENITEIKGYVGLKLSLLPVLNVVGEADFAQVSSYSLRLNLHF